MRAFAILRTEKLLKSLNRIERSRLKMVRIESKPNVKLLVTEIFQSLQGETSFMGLPFVFIRLTGCNLRCTYCDTTYAFKGKTLFSIKEIESKISQFKTRNILITGGEPLIQRGTIELIESLIERQYLVSMETHGEISIEKVPPGCRIVLDIKTPSSGMQRGGYLNNLPLLKGSGEVKFVIASQEDYFWARDLILTNPYLRTMSPERILLSPALPNESAPGTYPGVTWRWLAEQILKDGLQARYQLQLHKLIWDPHQRGV